MIRRPTATITPGLTSYLAVCAALGSLMIGQTVNQVWSTPDFWVYLGPVREFAARPLHPVHPLLVGDGADPYMGPYTWVLGLISRLLSADPTVVLAVAGLLNLLILLVGLWRLTRRFSSQPLAPVLALLFTLLAWGWEPWRWSGYLNLNSIGSGLPLGSKFATGLGLFVLAALVDWFGARGTRSLCVIALGFPIVVLTHQMTGLWVGLVGLGIALASARGLTLRSAAPLGVALAIGLLVVLLWPFFSVLDLLGSTGEFDSINARTYRLVAVRSVLALPGFVLLAVRLRQKPRDPLGLAAALVAVVFIFGWLTDRGSLGRVLPGLMLVAHITMADWFGSRLGSAAESARVRLRSTIFVGLILLIGLAGTAPGLVRGVPRALLPGRLANDSRISSVVAPFLGFADVLPASAVVAAPGGVSLAIGATAAKAIASPIPAPFVADNAQRIADNDAILDPATTTARRAALLATYGCSWLVVAAADAPALMAEIDGAEIVGVVAEYSIIRLPSAGALAP